MVTWRCCAWVISLSAWLIDKRWFILFLAAPFLHIIQDRTVCQNMWYDAVVKLLKRWRWYFITWGIWMWLGKCTRANKRHECITRENHKFLGQDFLSTESAEHVEHRQNSCNLVFVIRCNRLPNVLDSVRRAVCFRPEMKLKNTLAKIISKRLWLRKPTVCIG